MNARAPDTEKTAGRMEQYVKSCFSDALHKRAFRAANKPGRKYNPQ